jgi:hypothetical protein
MSGDVTAFTWRCERAYSAYALNGSAASDGFFPTFFAAFATQHPHQFRSAKQTLATGIADRTHRDGFAHAALFLTFDSKASIRLRIDATCHRTSTSCERASSNTRSNL